MPTGDMHGFAVLCQLVPWRAAADRNIQNRISKKMGRPAKIPEASGKALASLLCLALLAGTIVGLAGCGQKGSLYLPDRTEPAEQR